MSVSVGGRLSGAGIDQKTCQRAYEAAGDADVCRDEDVVGRDF
jgi:hypothetical protein